MFFILILNGYLSFIFNNNTLKIFFLFYKNNKQYNLKFKNNTK